MKIILISAITADGRIAKRHIEKIDWTIKEDKKRFAKVTKEAGVVIMGNNTFKSLKNPLPDRLNIVMTKKPVLGISKQSDTEFTNKHPGEIIEDLSERGFEKVFLIGGSEINTLFTKAKLINEIWLTVVPIVFGKGLSLFCENIDLNLMLYKKELLKNNLFLYYKTDYNIKN